MPRLFPGSVISKTPPTKNSTTASGVWSTQQQIQAIAASQWPLTVVSDPDFEYVTMLLPGNGTNGAQNNTFIDGSTNNFTITRNGNTTQGTFSPYGNNWSNYFDGTGDYLSVGTSTNLALGSGDFTVETWLYLDVYNASTSAVFDWRTAGGTPTNIPLLTLSASGAPTFYANVASGALIVGSSAVPLNAWAHLAVVRNGSGSNNVTMYLNGTSVGAATNTSNLGIETLRINDPQGSFGTKGYFSNARIVKGTAVYTAAFTPPTAPLTAITNTSLLTCQSNCVIDNSTNAFVITVNGNTSVQRFSPFSPTAAYSASTIGGSGYFDGTGDSLSIANNSALDLGSSNYTMEIWAYPTSFATSFELFTYYWYNSGEVGNRLIALLSSTTGFITAYFNDAGGSITASIALKLNSWNHVALVRNGTVITLYINGASAGTGTLSGSYPTNITWPVSVGAGYTKSGNTDFYYTTGYLSDFRVVIGTAVYTAAFTPPTAPLTAITNTKLLLNFTNAGIIDNAMMNDIETRGNAQISTTQSKFGGSSISLPSGVTNLTIPFNQNLAFDSGDFTIEGWVYPNAVSTGTIQSIYASPVNAAQYSAVIFEISAGNSFQVSFSTGASWNILRASCGTAVATTWQHFAIVRAGTTFYVFINGTQTYTTTISGALTPGVNPAVIGSGRFGVDSLYFQGFIDDFRITKGIARYTANFTAPTAAFPTS